MKQTLLKPEIGDHVYTWLNQKRMEGVLVCASGMGLTPFDLFNDILITESDLRTFLWQNNIEQCSNSVPGMIIQSYISFCEKSSAEIWTSSKVQTVIEDDVKDENLRTDGEIVYQKFLDSDGDSDDEIASNESGDIDAPLKQTKDKVGNYLIHFFI